MEQEDQGKNSLVFLPHRGVAPFLQPFVEVSAEVLGIGRGRVSPSMTTFGVATSPKGTTFEPNVISRHDPASVRNS